MLNVDRQPFEITGPYMRSSQFLYWPSGLEKRCKVSKEPMVIIAVKTCSTDPMVITVIEKSKFSDIPKPYMVIGTVYAGTTRFMENINKGYLIVCFDPPKLKMMQFYSLQPISLVLQNSVQDEEFISEDCDDDVVSPKIKERAKFNSKLSSNIDLLNLYYRHLEVFENRCPQYKERSTLYKSLFKLMKIRIRTSYFYKMLRCFVFYLAGIVRVIAGAVSHILNWKLLPLVKIFATAQQIDLRCQQLCYIPVQYLRINKNMMIPEIEPRVEEMDNCVENANSESRRRSKSHHSMYPKELPCETYPDYIRLYNTLWLMINDISFGATLGAIMYDNRELISQHANYVLKKLLYDIPIQATSLLEANPLGIKLNEELSKFLSSLFLLIIEFSYKGWIELFINPEALQRGIIFASNVSSIIGLTFVLALAVDFLSILTIHITLFYMISVKLYHSLIYVMKSLFYLFYGKKQNVLRKRIDTNYFELDQLLMGTLIFTVLMFLLPTLLSFYLVYTAFRITDLFVKVTFELLLALINHFPLFALLLRIKDPKRLPGGITLSTDKNFYFLANNPLSFKLMFRPFTNVMRSFQLQTVSISTLKKIGEGSVLNLRRDELYRVLYYSLPRYPIDARLLWHQLKKAM